MIRKTALFILCSLILLTLVPAVSGQGGPTLTVGTSGLVVGPGRFVTVPVVLDTAGNDIAAVVFEIDYDQTLLLFQSVTPVACARQPDFNCGLTNDGQPDGELDVTVNDTSSPLASLDDGTVIELRFMANAGVTAVTQACVNFSTDPRPSFGGTAGQSIPGTSVNGCVTIDPAAANQPPVARDDHFAINLGTGVLINPLIDNGNGADFDPDGGINPLSVVNTTPTLGILNPAGAPGSGVYFYFPTLGIPGCDSYTYTIADNEGLRNPVPATVRIAVGVPLATCLPVANRPPDAVDDIFVGAEDTELNVPVPGVLGNDTDPDGNILTVTVLTDVSNGTLTLNTNGSFTYTPDADFFGTESFNYTASDGSLTDSARVIIDVRPTNDAPVARDDNFFTVNEDAVLNAPVPGVLQNDTDIDPGDVLTAGNASDPAHGSVVLNANGSFSYTPDANYNGPDSFTYEVSDGDDSDTGTVNIPVNAVNDAPVAGDDEYTTTENTPLNVPAPGVLANDSDVDGHALTTSININPSNGTATLDKNTGALTYTPNTGFSGIDSFTYAACDGQPTTLCDTATVTINVVAGNDAPTAVDDNYTVDEDDTLVVSLFDDGVLGNDSDPEGSQLTANLLTDVTHGTLALAADGTFTYTPNANFFDTDSFTYEVCDPEPLCDTGLATITVNAVGDAPNAVGDTATTNEDTTVSNIPVLANDTDIDTGDVLNVISATAGANGTTSVNLATDTVNYTPNLNFFGTDSFSYTIQDSFGLQHTATVTVTVNPINDAPVANDDAYSVDEGQVLTVAAPGVLGNDTDVDGPALTAGVQTAPSSGILTLNPDGGFTYTPNAGFNGTDVFIYVASDGSASDPATVVITVGAVNDAPVAVDDAYSTNEDTVLNVAAPGVLTNDTDPDSPTLTVASNTQPLHGTATVSADGSFTYTPSANYNGPDSFTYTVCDAQPLCDTGTVTITVNAVNDAPVAVNDAYTVNEDATLTIAAPGVLGNDTDVEGSTLTALLGVTTTNGTLTLNANGSFTYTPNANYNGSDSFTYRANDGTANSNLATVTITVNAVNDAPVAVNESFTANEDTAVNGNVLTNDTDVEGNALTAALVSNVAHGTLTLNPDGSFTYTPNTNFNGGDSFTYQANDGTTNSNVATVSITVNAVNDAPVANDDAYSTQTDTTLNVDAPGILGNDTDVDGDTLVVQSSSPVSFVTINSDGSLTLAPTGGFTGQFTVDYVVSDGNGGTDTGQVTFTVTAAPNRAPVAIADSYTTDEDTILNIAAAGVLTNDTDADGDTLTAALVTNAAHGNVVLSSDGSFVYTPAANYNGPDSFTYRANDGLADSNVATVTITVNAVNDAPVAIADGYSTNEDTALNIAAPGVLTNDTDIDGGSLTAALVSTTSSGALTFNADGSFTYTPNSHFNGPDSFTYKANDGALDSNTVTVSITVNAVNDAPVAANDSYTTDEDTPLNIVAPGVLTNDTDVDGGSLTAALVSTTTNGALTLNPDGSFTYTPNTNFNGSDSFTYKANDGALDSNVATVSITINVVNDAPVAVDDSYNTSEGQTLNIAAPGVLTNDTDVDNDSLTAVLVSATGNGTLALNADGSFSYTPNANYNGTDSFTYKANDGALDSNVATVTINIGAVNVAPVAGNDAYATGEDTALNVAAPGVLTNDNDEDGDTLTAVLVSTTTNGVLTLNPDGSFSYTPNTNFNGSDSFTYQANDGQVSGNIATVIITVNAVNDAPVAVDDSYNTNEGQTLTIAAPGVLTNDADVDSPTLTAALVSTTTNGALTLNADGSFSYTPNSNFNGSDSFTYKANDGSADSNVATVTINIGAVNVAPVAGNDGYVTDEDTALNIAAPGVLTNDTDDDGDSLTAALVSTTTNGALTLNADGSFSYTPNANFNGSDSFTYKANDGQADSNVATVTITVNAVNDAPVAVDDSYSTNEDTALIVPVPGVLGNDTDVDGDTLCATWETASGPLNGGIDLNCDGSFTYTPNPNFSGLDSFTYKANDGALDSNTATVTINVVLSVEPPVAGDDSYTTNEDTALNVAAPGVLTNDTDDDGDSLTAALVSSTTNGALTLNADGSFSYTPNTNFNGSDSFTYKANDGQADSNVATVAITVNAVNDAPVADNDAYATLFNTVLNVAAPGVLDGDTDVDNASLTAALVSGPTNGTLALNANGSFSYTPNTNFSGGDSFTYKANDGAVDSNTATVTITVGASSNTAPLANNDGYTIAEDTPLVVGVPGVLGNDTDANSNPLVAVLVTAPAHGALVFNSDGSFSYMPHLNYNGSDSFTYKANDGALDSNVATVAITITSVNDNPVAVADNFNTAAGTPITLALASLLTNDSDPDGNPLTITSFAPTSPLNGTVVNNGNGSFTYTPAPGFTGTLTGTYNISDGQGGTASANVTVTVGGAPTNRPPVANNNTYSVNEDAVLNVAAPGVLGNDTDPDGNALTAILVTGPAHGTLVLNANGSFSYTPSANYSGPDSFTYKANDGALDSNVATVNITVRAVNDNPIALADTFTTPQNTPITVALTSLLANDSDADGNPLTVTSLAPVGMIPGTVVNNGNGTFTYTPAPGFTGTVTGTYTISDGQGGTATAIVTMTVTPVSAPAQIGNSSIEVTDEPPPTEEPPAEESAPPEEGETEGG